jgi:uncharacterized DUF497 family protein
MRFEWDREKAQTNVRKHDVSFDEAVTVFYDPLSATIGYSARGRLMVVAHTQRGATVRIISARRATARERRRHET